MAQPHQPILHLRAAGHLDPVPFRPAYGADQDRVRIARGLQGFVAAERAVRVPGGAVDQVFVDCQGKAADPGGCFQYCQTAGQNLGPDPVAPQRQYPKRLPHRPSTR